MMSLKATSTQRLYRKMRLSDIDDDDDDGPQDLTVHEGDYYEYHADVPVVPSATLLYDHRGNIVSSKPPKEPIGYAPTYRR